MYFSYCNECSRYSYGVNDGIHQNLVKLPKNWRTYVFSTVFGQCQRLLISVYFGVLWDSSCGLGVPLGHSVPVEGFVA